MVSQHLTELAALFMEADLPLSTGGVEVFDAHVDDSGDAGEAVEHHPNQRPVAQADEVGGINRVEELPGLHSREHRRLALLR